MLFWALNKGFAAGASQGQRLQFLRLPTGKVRDERRMINVINSTRSGKLNAVGDFVIPDAIASPWVQADTRVSVWSAVILIATNDAARTMQGAGVAITAGDEVFSVVYSTPPSGSANFRYVVIG